jgi:hypothetical protein
MIKATCMGALQEPTSKSGPGNELSTDGCAPPSSFKPVPMSLGLLSHAQPQPQHVLLVLVFGLVLVLQHYNRVAKCTTALQSRCNFSGRL